MPGATNTHLGKNTIRLSRVILSLGESESFTIKGTNNITPVFQTSIPGGILMIKTKENINLTGMNDNNVLDFTIVVKDLTFLTLSGGADDGMDSLSTS